MAIEKLSVILELVSGSYQREARNAANATGQIGNSARSVTGQLGAMIGPAAIGGAILGLGKMAVAAGENADRLFDLQAQTGLSTDALQEWEFVAKAAGATTEVFSDAVKAVIRNLDGTKGATGAAAKAYEALGISVKDANGNLREGGEITAEVFDKLASMTNITERNALAQDIFGKKWEETISILDLGSEALGKLRKEGQGTVISAANLRSADRFREAIEKLKASANQLVNQGMGSIAPLLTAIADEASDAVAALDGFFSVVDRGITAITGNAEATNEAREAADKYSSILDILVPGITASLAPWGELNAILEDNATAAATAAEAHDSWMTVVPRLVSVIGPTIDMIDRQGQAFSNAAKAADSQRTALIRLADYQRSQLSPIANFIQLQEELAAAQETLTTAQADGETPASDLAQAQIAVADAMLAISSAGLSLNAEEIQAFAQLLITDFGYSQEAAQNLLETLGLFDGFVVNAKVVVTMESVIAGGGRGGSGNINTDILGFDSGGIVPGRRGEPSLILAHGGETILPTHKGFGGRSYSPTFIAMSPMNNARQDMQYLTILASVTNLVEGF